MKRIKKTRYREVGDQIAKECKRRHILHYKWVSMCVVIMALVIGEQGYQLYQALPAVAQEQVRNFILSLPGRAYEHRHRIIDLIKKLQQTPRRSDPDADRGQVGEEISSMDGQWTDTCVDRSKEVTKNVIEPKS